MTEGQPKFEDRFTFRVDEDAEDKGSVLEALAELLIDLWEEEQETPGKDDTDAKG